MKNFWTFYTMNETIRRTYEQMDYCLRQTPNRELRLLIEQGLFEAERPEEKEIRVRGTTRKTPEAELELVSQERHARNEQWAAWLSLAGALYEQWREKIKPQWEEKIREWESPSSGIDAMKADLEASRDEMNKKQIAKADRAIREAERDLVAFKDTIERFSDPHRAMMLIMSKVDPATKRKVPKFLLELGRPHLKAEDVYKFLTDKGVKIPGESPEDQVKSLDQLKMQHTRTLGYPSTEKERAETGEAPYFQDEPGQVEIQAKLADHERYIASMYEELGKNRDPEEVRQEMREQGIDILPDERMVKEYGVIKLQGIADKVLRGEALDTEERAIYQAWQDVHQSAGAPEGVRHKAALEYMKRAAAQILKGRTYPVEKGRLEELMAIIPHLGTDPKNIKAKRDAGKTLEDYEQRALTVYEKLEKAAAIADEAKDNPELASEQEILLSNRGQDPGAAILIAKWPLYVGWGTEEGGDAWEAGGEEFGRMETGSREVRKEMQVIDRLEYGSQLSPEDQVVWEKLKARVQAKLTAGQELVPYEQRVQALIAQEQQPAAVEHNLYEETEEEDQWATPVYKLMDVVSAYDKLADQGVQVISQEEAERAYLKTVRQHMESGQIFEPADDWQDPASAAGKSVRDAIKRWGRESEKWAEGEMVGKRAGIAKLGIFAGEELMEPFLYTPEAEPDQNIIDRYKDPETGKELWTDEVLLPVCRQAVSLMVDRIEQLGPYELRGTRMPFPGVNLCPRSQSTTDPVKKKEFQRKYGSYCRDRGRDIADGYCGGHPNSGAMRIVEIMLAPYDWPTLIERVAGSWPNIERATLLRYTGAEKWAGPEGEGVRTGTARWLVWREIYNMTRGLQTQSEINRELYRAAQQNVAPELTEEQQQFQSEVDALYARDYEDMDLEMYMEIVEKVKAGELGEISPIEKACLLRKTYELGLGPDQDPEEEAEAEAGAEAEASAAVSPEVEPE